MESISKSQFDQIVQEYYTPSPEDSPKVVAKYSYEAHRAAIEEIMISARDRYLDGQELEYDPSPEELVYLLIVDDMDIDFKMAHAYELSLSNLLHGLILIDINIINVFPLFTQNERYWNVTELHWYNSELTPFVNESGEDYNLGYLQARREEFHDTSFNKDLMKIIGIYDNSAGAWHLLRLDHLPIEWLMVREIGEYQGHSIDNMVIRERSLKILDVDPRMTRRTFPNVDHSSNIMNPEPNARYFIRTAEWFTMRGTHTTERSFTTGPNMNTLVLPSLSSTLIINQDLVELHGIFHGHEIPYVRISDSDQTEIVKLEYRSHAHLIHQEAPSFDNLPNLNILHIYGEGVKSYSDNFAGLLNVTELKITPSRDSRDDKSIPESIYEMPSLETLILSGVSLGTLGKLDLERFEYPIEIKIERLLYDSDEDIVTFVREYENILDLNRVLV